MAFFQRFYFLGDLINFFGEINIIFEGLIFYFEGFGFFRRFIFFGEINIIPKAWFFISRVLIIFFGEINIIFEGLIFLFPCGWFFFKLLFSEVRSFFGKIKNNIFSRVLTSLLYFRRFDIFFGKICIIFEGLIFYFEGSGLFSEVLFLMVHFFFRKSQKKWEHRVTWKATQSMTKFSEGRKIVWPISAIRPKNIMPRIGWKRTPMGQADLLWSFDPSAAFFISITFLY